MEKASLRVGSRAGGRGVLADLRRLRARVHERGHQPADARHELLHPGARS